MRLPKTAIGVFCLFVLRLGAVGCSPGGVGEGLAKKTNVVLILGDYMGYGDLGSYGVPDIKTPQLDRLAREGVRMVNAYASAPVCTPSRTALLTGRYQQRAGLETNVSHNNPSFGLASSEITIAKILKDAGYATALFGKWHLGRGPEFGPNAHGFDEFFGIHDWSIDYYSHKTYTGEPGLYENTKLTDQEGYSTHLFTDRAVSFIEQHVSDPFFLYLSYNAALPPCQPPGQPEDIRTQETWGHSTREDYVKVVEALDAGVGRVLETLDRNDLAENTLVIFTYDHGGSELSRREPLSNGFGTLWEGGIRVPCLLRWPERLPAGKVSGQLAINMDLAASILAATGTTPPLQRKLDGINLLPILQSQRPAVERTFCWRINFPTIGRQKAVRNGRWKYLVDGGTEMLFDLEKDVGERHDLVYRHPEVLKRLRDYLAEWEREISPSS